jgi:large subunit ribosomal protein L1
MGKVRIKTLGDESVEKKEKEESKKKQEQKKITKASGVKSEEKVVSAITTEEKISALDKNKTAKDYREETKKTTKFNKRNKAFARSKKYNLLLDKFDKNKVYSLNEGLDILEKLQRNSFDETVELHINTLSQGISGNIALPHGTGKKTRVAIATDALISEVEKGKIDFDILIATPSMMPKLARIAKILGPRGLMPNPKNGTITDNPQDLVKKYEGGQISFKTESKAPILHLTVGKMSFGKEKLIENANALFNAIKKQNIASITLKSTMSPGVKIKI